MLHLALGLDIKYVMQCGVAISSVCENNKGEEVFFHILVLAEKSELNHFSDLVDIVKGYNQKYEIIAIGEAYFEKLPQISYISKATYLRLLLPQVISPNIDQLLYLDSDIVVLGSLHYFVENPLRDDIACGAAIDVNGCSIKHHNRLGISSSVTYFNAGILQMNLKYWRKHNISDQTINKVSENQYWFMDQDAINVVLSGKIHRIPFKYNLQTSHYLYLPIEQELDIVYHQELLEAMDKPVIIHYASYRKPWFDDCPKREYWEYYFKKTKWANEPLLCTPPNDDTTQEWLHRIRSKDNRLLNKYAPTFYKMLYWASRSKLSRITFKCAFKFLSLFLHLFGF